MALENPICSLKNPWRVSDTSRLGRPFAKDPCVVNFNGRTLLYYSVPSNQHHGWGIGIMESKDLLSWEKVGQLEAEQPAEGKGIAAPFALAREGVLHLFYQSYEGGPKDAICHAVSQDGIHFKRDETNPIFRPNVPWSVGRAIDVEVASFRDRWFLYYATRDPSYKYQLVGVAVSKGGFSASDWREGSPDGPILKPELPWEKECIEAPTLVEHGGSLFMFYAGAYNNSPQVIGCAVSQDGLHWKRVSDKPILTNGSTGTWNSSEAGHPGIYRDADGQTYLFYQGNNDLGKTWWISRKRVVWSTHNLPVLID
jgi:predicted GH43/DUF377 family glycosyl hydrolase